MMDNCPVCGKPIDEVYAVTCSVCGKTVHFPSTDDSEYKCSCILSRLDACALAFICMFCLEQQS